MDTLPTGYKPGPRETEHFEDQRKPSFANDLTNLQALILGPYEGIGNPPKEADWDVSKQPPEWRNRKIVPHDPMLPGPGDEPADLYAAGGALASRSARDVGHSNGTDDSWMGRLPSVRNAADDAKKFLDNLPDRLLSEKAHEALAGAKGDIDHLSGIDNLMGDRKFSRPLGYAAGGSDSDSTSVSNSARGDDGPTFDTSDIAAIMKKAASENRPFSPWVPRVGMGEYGLPHIPPLPKHEAEMRSANEPAADWVAQHTNPAIGRATNPFFEYGRKAGQEWPVRALEELTGAPSVARGGINIKEGIDRGGWESLPQIAGGAAEVGLGLAPGVGAIRAARPALGSAAGMLTTAGLAGAASALPAYAEDLRMKSPAQVELEDLQAQYNDAKTKLNKVMGTQMPNKDYSRKLSPARLKIERDNDARTFQEGLKLQGQPYSTEMERLSPLLNAAQERVRLEGETKLPFRQQYPGTSRLLQGAGEILPALGAWKYGRMLKSNVDSALEDYNAGVRSGDAAGVAAAERAKDMLRTYADPSWKDWALHEAGLVGAGVVGTTGFNIAPELSDLASSNPDVKQNAKNKLLLGDPEYLKERGILIGAGGVLGPFIGKEVGRVFPGWSNLQQAKAVAESKPVPKPPAAQNPMSKVTDLGPKGWSEEAREIARDYMKSRIGDYKAVVPAEILNELRNEDIIANPKNVGSRLGATKDALADIRKTKSRAPRAHDVEDMAKSFKGKPTLAIAPAAGTAASLGSDSPEASPQGEQPDPFPLPQGPAPLPPIMDAARVTLRGTGGNVETQTSETPPFDVPEGHRHVPAGRGSKIQNEQTGQWATMPGDKDNASTTEIKTNVSGGSQDGGKYKSGGAARPAVTLARNLTSGRKGYAWGGGDNSSPFGNPWGNSGNSWGSQPITNAWGGTGPTSLPVPTPYSPSPSPGSYLPPGTGRPYGGGWTPQPRSYLPPIPTGMPSRTPYGGGPMLPPIPSPGTSPSTPTPPAGSPGGPGGLPGGLPPVGGGTAPMPSSPVVNLSMPQGMPGNGTGTPTAPTPPMPPYMPSGAGTGPGAGAPGATGRPAMLPPNQPMGNPAQPQNSAQMQPPSNETNGFLRARGGALNLAHSLAHHAPRMPHMGHMARPPANPNRGGPGGPAPDSPLQVGPVVGPTGGRADAKAVDVPAGSYILPAETVSHVGGSNTAAGLEALDKLFGMPARDYAAKGGSVGSTVPIQISDGEYCVPPEVVAKIGNGDLQQGHRTLDALVLKLRKQHIATLSKLPGPAK